MGTDASRAQPDVTAAALSAVRDFLGGPHNDGDQWVFEFGDHLHSNWEAVYGGAIAAGALAVARATLPEQSPRSIHVQMVRSLPSGPAHATAEVRHAGRVVGTVEVAMFDARRKLAALSVVTMVTPGAVASAFHNVAATPPIETVEAPFSDGISQEWMPPITKALRLGNWDGDVAKGQFVSLNYRLSVDGTDAGASFCTVPWDNLDDTGPEAACLLANSLVTGQIVLSHTPRSPRTEPRSLTAVHDGASNPSHQWCRHPTVRAARNSDGRPRGSSR